MLFRIGNHPRPATLRGAMIAATVQLLTRFVDYSLRDGMEKTCFVMQHFDKGRYDRLYDEIFAPAIKGADLIPYRVDKDPAASIPIDTIAEQIAGSVACFAELSEDNPNVWFELGFAIAKDKPLCLVCSTIRKKFPFDVQHRQIIPYSDNPVPSDFAKLQQQITDRLLAVVAENESRRQNAEIAKSMSIAPGSDGLQPHELLALTNIFQYQYQRGVGVWTLTNEMETGGYTKPATSIAIAGLRHKGLIQFKSVEDQNGDFVDRLFVSDLGEKWLLANQQKLNLRFPPDEDIPF
jgi:hypothetical protein